MQFQNRIKNIVALGFLLLTAGAVDSNAQKPSQNWDHLMEYQEAHNADRLNELMKYYADSVEFVVTGAWVVSGKEEMRKKEDYDLGMGSDIEFNLERISGDTIFARVSEKNDWYDAIGVDRFEFESVAFIFNDRHQITKVIARPNEAVNTYLEQTIEQINQWASTHKKDVYIRLNPEGEFVFNRENAKLWLELTNLWMEAKKQ